MSTSGVNPALVQKDSGPLRIIQQESAQQEDLKDPFEAMRPKEPEQRRVFDKIVTLSAQYGVHTETAIEISRCESNLRQYDRTESVVRGEINNLDVGAFQINEKYHLERSQELGFDIETTDGNIEYAMWLMKKEGTKPWIWSKPCWSKAMELRSV